MGAYALSASALPAARHHTVSQHSDDQSFLEERTEVGVGVGLDAQAAAESGARIPGLSVLISALVDEILGPDVKRVADFVTVRLDHRLLVRRAPPPAPLPLPLLPLFF